MFAIFKWSYLLFRRAQKRMLFCIEQLSRENDKSNKTKIIRVCMWQKEPVEYVCVRVHVYARAQCAWMKWRDWHYVRTTEMRQYWYAGVLVEGRHRLMPRHRSLSVGRFDETDTTWRAVTGFFITRCTGLYSLRPAYFFLSATTK